jgi:hypothetical protein
VRAAPVDKATPLQTRVEVSQDPVIALAGTQILRPFDPMWDHFRQDQVKFRVSVKAAAIRVGDVELVGSRIRAASRGLFRLVGRMLRLN